MSIRLATSAALPDKVFPRVQDLAAEILVWRRDRGLALRPVTLARSGLDPETGCSVYAYDHDGERSDHFGYVLMGIGSELTIFRLSEALKLLQPEARAAA